MNTFESKNRRAVGTAYRAGHSVMAAFDARQIGSVKTPNVEPTAARATLERKQTEAIPLNAQLANKVLTALPDDVFECLRPHLELVALSAGEDLCQFDGGIPYAYFPMSTVISHLHVLADGNTAEAAMIGREGFVGLSAIFNACQPDYWTRVLIGGSALRIRMDILKQEFSCGGALQRALLAYAGAHIAQLSQRAVCIGRHNIEARLSCWLLMVHDRTGEDQLQLTHELIANHLGVRRAGVTVTTCTLRDKGLISYSRGFIHVIDRQGLEDFVCECYQMLG